jgi:hypothetical protein
MKNIIKDYILKEKKYIEDELKFTDFDNEKNKLPILERSKENIEELIEDIFTEYIKTKTEIFDEIKKISNKEIKKITPIVYEDDCGESCNTIEIKYTDDTKLTFQTSKTFKWENPDNINILNIWEYKNFPKKYTEEEMNMIETMLFIIESNFPYDITKKTLKQ